MPREPRGWITRVPSSTSNLGPGFDLLGLALSLHLEVRVTPIGDREHDLRRSGEGAPDLPGPRDDWILRAFERLRSAHPFEGRFRFDVRSEIPVGRGLGSSGAAIVAGLLLARALSGRALPEDELLEMGIELEGHPDNVAAALSGGLTLCARAGSRRKPAGPRWRRIAAPLSPRLGFAVAWPAQPLPTPRARAVLPAQVPFGDAVENPRRLAFLLEGLRSGNREFVELGGEDRLHVPYRLPLLPGSEHAFEAARAAGAWLATLSGAGSGLVAIGERGAMEPVARAMAQELRSATGFGTGRVLEPVHGRAQVGPVE